MVFRTPGDRRVRPSFRDELKDAFKIYLSPANFPHINPGDVCILETSQGVAGPAVAWTATEKIKDDVVQLSRALQKLYSIKLDSRITMSYSNVSVMDAFDITLREVPFDGSAAPLSSLGKDESLGWAVLLKSYLQEADLLTPGLEFDNVTGFGCKKTFQILQINSSTDQNPYRASLTSKVRIIEQTSQDDKHYRLSVSTRGVGGLSAQLTQINAKLEAFQSPCDPNFHPFYQPCEGGIILYGPSGTGKSLVLSKIAAVCWCQVVRVKLDILSHGYDGARAAMDRMFSMALDNQPSAIIIDNLESFATFRDARDPSGPWYGPLLMEQLERLVNSRTLVVGATQNLSDIHPNLRKAEYFMEAIEFPIPDTKSRFEILKAIGNLPEDVSHSTLETIAAQTHGFVGADLKYLLGQAMRNFTARIKEEQGDASTAVPNEPEALFTDMHDDLSNALSYVRPRASQDARLDIPKVKWTDIAGQAEVKKILEEALEWPIKYPKVMAELRLKSRKGLLLYGPPGCSKTMTARATATESSMNFMAVMGSELTSMYVGESERKLRELFCKARALRPSIVFFDEIDAIGAKTAGGQQGVVQTVTTLLNELDGLVAMEGIFVLAATNKPEVLDPALLRAGRLDTTIYVGLPDAEARRDILRMEIPTTTDYADVIDQNALTESTVGFSGAEMVQLCENARYAAASDIIELRGERLLGQRHFKNALAKAQKSVTPQMLQGYEAWGAGRR